ncbi:MAG: GFA family protein [Proteobacteria bacterium]|nr:MAG: GFA family protein [Pseudomonadota bacterium]QKK11063.1 MAG: GFA family protein [Pseudomonadota bacterium]
MPNPYRGCCLCGGVKFEFDEFLPHVAHCHCSMCRKFHGAAYATYASVPRAKFRWIAGEHLLKGYTAGNGTTRTFCGHCGSSLMFFSPKAPEDVIEIALGTVDGTIPIQPDAHIFVAYGANWAVINDGLPQYTEGRDSAQVKQ